MDVSQVPGTPEELHFLLEEAERCEAIHVEPFPTPSWLWTAPPDGWLIGTDTWCVSFEARYGWAICYSDDDGSHSFLTPEQVHTKIKEEAARHGSR